MDIKNITLGMTVYVGNPETGDAEGLEVTAINADGTVELDGCYTYDAGDVYETEQEACEAAEYELEDILESAHCGAYGHGRFDMFGDPEWD